jgi:hypothetical protein
MPPDQHAPLTRPPRRAAFVFVFVTVVLDMLAIGIIISRETGAPI